MAITAKNESGPGILVPSGTYAARCYSMVHIGTNEEEYMGKKKMLNKVRITWELPTELKVFKEENGEQPYSISKEFTLSMYEKANLRKFLESWRGKGFTEQEAKEFDISALIGVPCMLSVIHKVSKSSGKPYADISAVSTVPKGMDVPKQINESFEFSFENFDEKKLQSLPEFLRNKIYSSEEYKQLTDPSHTETQEEPQATDIEQLPF